MLQFQQQESEQPQKSQSAAKSEMEDDMRLLKTELLTEFKPSKTELVRKIDSLDDASRNQQIQCLLCCKGKA